MTNNDIELLISQGYVKLPSLRSIEDPSEIINAKHSSTYTSGSEFQKRYHEIIDLNKITSSRE